MPRVPVTIQSANFGTRNAAGPASGRSVVLPTVKMPAGVAQPRSRFTGLQGLDTNVARQLDQLQDFVAQAVRLVKSVPFLDGNLIQGQTIAATGSTTVAHGLGRAWSGYEMKNIQNNPASSYFALHEGPADLQTILIVNGGATFVCDVWVY